MSGDGRTPTHHVVHGRRRGSGRQGIRLPFVRRVDEIDEIVPRYVVFRFVFGVPLGWVFVPS